VLARLGSEVRDRHQITPITSNVEDITARFIEHVLGSGRCTVLAVSFVCILLLRVETILKLVA